MSTEGEVTGPKAIGWAELEALQALARGGSLQVMRGPLRDLTAALDLGGYKFCIATSEPDGYRITAVIAGGDLDAAPEGFLDVKIGPQDPILWESYRAVTPVSWTPYFTDRRLMEMSGVSKLACAVNNAITQPSRRQYLDPDTANPPRGRRAAGAGIGEWRSNGSGCGI